MILSVAYFNAECHYHSWELSNTNPIAEVRGLQSNLTLAEIKSKEAKLQREVCA